MKNEKGIATIIALGVVSLLLCLGLAYITTSIVEKKAASNFQNLTVARLAARSALNRALALMKSRDTRLPVDSIAYSYSKYYTGVNSDTELADLREKLKITIDGVNYTFPTLNYSADTPLGWIYLSSNGTPDKFQSRIAYVVITDSGKLDPSAVVAAYPSEVNIGVAQDGIETTGGSSGTPIIGRPGKNVNEIFLRSVTATNPWLTSTGVNSYVDQMSVVGSNLSSNPKLTAGQRWADYDQIFAAININEADTIKFKDLFTLYEPATPELFWKNSNGDTIRNTAELYNRFNLSRTDWGSLTVSSFTGASSTDTTTANTNFLPWLKNWKSSGDFATDTDARNQIIANLIDYCDSNDTATTDDPTLSNPTYVGLEKVPYINEVRARISVYLNKNGSGAKDWTYLLSVPQIDVEIVNMYGLPSSFQSKAIITMTISYLIGTETFTQSTSGTQAITFSTLGNQYTQGSISYPIGFTGGKTDNKYNVSALDVVASITSFKIKLVSNNSAQTPYDFVNLSPVNAIASFSVNDNSTVSYYLDFQVRDPRQNHNLTDWAQAVGTSSTIGTLTSPFTNSNYPASLSGADTDTEPNKAPWSLSTAYIRNAEMKSPWELGFIHRAKAFQTLNLKKYNTAEGYSNTAGGNAYGDGDANILDQIKMTSATMEYGKVNLNTKNDTVLRALFEKIRIGSNPDTPGWLTNFSIRNDNNSDTAAVISQIIRAYTADTMLSTRAEILANNSTVGTKLTTLAGQTNDRTQEEVIGKFINLTDANPGNVFYIIAIGESFRDLPNSSGAFLKYEDNSDFILSTQKIFAIVQRNPADNSFSILRIQYLTD